MVKEEAREEAEVEIEEIDNNLRAVTCYSQNGQNIESSRRDVTEV